MSSCGPNCGCRNRSNPNENYRVGDYVQFTDHFYANHANLEEYYVRTRQTRPVRGCSYYVLSVSADIVTVALPNGEKMSAAKYFFKWK
jgi:hypothetical protein